MAICVDCLSLTKQNEVLQERYDSLLNEHRELLKTSTKILENQRVAERDQQIALTNSALKSFQNKPITLSPPLEDENDE